MAVGSLVAGIGFSMGSVRRVGRWAGLLAVIALLASLQGCAVNRSTASVTPDRDISALKKYYVVKFDRDNRGINQLIASDLQRRGFSASTGREADVPKDADAVVTYVDKWQWDITLYLIQLTLHVREPGTQNVLATAEAYHTSLTRLAPAEMVAEVLDNIFSKTGSAASKAPPPRSSSDNMVLTVPPYEARAAGALAQKSTVRMDPVRDARKDATGSLVGERTALSVTMGKVEMSPIPVEMVGQVLRSELAAKGVRTVASDEDVTLRARLTKFDVRTPSTLLYWDMNGVIAVELSVAGRDGKANELRYEVTCTDRTYAGPSQALLTQLVSTCLGNLGRSLREDPGLSAALATR